MRKARKVLAKYNPVLMAARACRAIKYWVIIRIWPAKFCVNHSGSIWGAEPKVTVAKRVTHPSKYFIAVTILGNRVTGIAWHNIVEVVNRSTQVEDAFRKVENADLDHDSTKAGIGGRGGKAQRKETTVSKLRQRLTPAAMRALIMELREFW